MIPGKYSKFVTIHFSIVNLVPSPGPFMPSPVQFSPVQSILMNPCFLAAGTWLWWLRPTVQYTTVHYSTVQYTTLHYTTLHYTTLKYSTVQYSTVLYCTVLYSTVHWCLASDGFGGTIAFCLEPRN